MPELITVAGVEENYKTNTARRFEELVDKFNNEVPNYYKSDGVFTFPFITPEDLQPQFRKLFDDSKEWVLVSLTTNNITLKARKGSTDAR